MDLEKYNEIIYRASIAKLQGGTLRTLMYLLSQSLEDTKNNTVVISQYKMAKDIDVKRTFISTSVTTLKRMGFIEVSKKGYYNVYKFL